MFNALLNVLSGCSHRKTSFPLTPRRKLGNNVGRTETYVVCLDCGTEFAYDCKEMRIRESIKNSDSGHLIASPFAALRLHATPVGAVPVEPSLFPGNPGLAG